MNDELKMIYGILGLLFASGLLTWLTKPAYFEPVYRKRRKKNKTKLRLQDKQPYLTELKSSRLTDMDLPNPNPAQPMQDV
jgi:hypothetical protein